MESPALPSDMIFNILTRTSLETVGRCRLVSKDWNLITYESSFSQRFCQTTKTISGYFVQSIIHNKHTSQFVSTNNSKLSLSFLPSRAVKIVAASKQGILLCLNEYPKRSNIPEYYICKPSTKQWAKLPNPRTRYLTKGTAIVVLGSNPLRYKIVRLSEPKDRCVKYKSKWHECYRCEIFDSETWAWKKVNDVRLPYGVFLGFEPAVSSGGALHWLMSNNHIFAFCEEKESWTVFDLPYPMCSENYFKYMKLVEYNGRLGMVCMGKNELMEIWVMVDYETKVWRKIEAINTDESHYPLTLYNSDVAFMQGFYKVMYYNFRTGTSHVINVDKQMNPQGVFPFQSDLEPINFQDPTTVKTHIMQDIHLCFKLFLIFVSFVLLFLLFVSHVNSS